jgi:hypothetical protein
MKLEEVIAKASADVQECINGKNFEDLENGEILLRLERILQRMPDSPEMKNGVLKALHFVESLNNEQAKSRLLNIASDYLNEKIEYTVAYAQIEDLTKNSKSKSKSKSASPQQNYSKSPSGRSLKIPRTTKRRITMRSLSRTQGGSELSGLEECSICLEDHNVHDFIQLHPRDDPRKHGVCISCFVIMREQHTEPCPLCRGTINPDISLDPRMSFKGLCKLLSIKIKQFIETLPADLFRRSPRARNGDQNRSFFTTLVGDRMSLMALLFVILMLYGQLTRGLSPVRRLL